VAIIYLKDLSEDHPLRNLPLGQIKAEIRNIWQTKWRSVSNWRVARATYNELGPVWIECSQWRVQT
jgi:hypothetical protein